MIKDISKVSSVEELPTHYNRKETAPETETEMPAAARAALLTERIRANGQLAAASIVAMYRDLRIMKIENLFLELGYDSFEDYTCKEFGFQKRQAYNYIAVYEKLGEEFLQANAKLGIGKLVELIQLNPEDRAEVLENNDLEGMTTREIRKLIADYKQQGEQLSLLEEKVEEMESVRMDTTALIDKAEELEGERDELAAQVKELRQTVKELEASKGKPEIVEKVVEKEVVKEVSDTQELNLARQLQKEAETKAEKAEERAEGAEKKLDKKHKDLLAAEKRAKEAQTELQELKDKLAAEAEKHREELEKVKAEAQKPVDNGDKQSFKHAYAASYKELTGLLEIIDSTDDKQERQIFTAKTEQLLALVGEKLRSLEEK